MRACSAAAIAALLLLAGVMAPGCRRDAESRPPRRIVLISIDTLRPDHLGAYGYPRPTSPVLDAVAKQGVVFEDASAPSPWTLPSHASLLTGLYPSRHALTSHEVRLPESVATLASLLEAGGFVTAAVVNSHNLSSLFGLERGFREFQYVKELVSQREPSRSITDQATEWIRRYVGQRLFLFVHYYDVHSDYRSRPEYEQQFVRPYTGSADGTTAQMIASRAGQLAFREEDAQHLIDLYDAGIRQMDDELARLFTAVDDGEETLLVITSDHGEEFLEHGGVLHGRTQFEEVVRVPLILRAPGIPRGVRVATPVSLIDVMPTLLAAAGLAVPPSLDGADLAPTWRGAGRELGERHFYYEADHNNAEPDVTRAVRHRKDKLHFNRLTSAVTLFDLTTDPGEHVDLVGRRPEVSADLRAKLDAFREVHREAGGAVTLSPEQQERLRSLGYVR